MFGSVAPYLAVLLPIAIIAFLNIISKESDINKGESKKNVKSLGESLGDELIKASAGIEPYASKHGMQKRD